MPAAIAGETLRYAYRRAFFCRSPGLFGPILSRFETAVRRCTIATRLSPHRGEGTLLENIEPASRADRQPFLGTRPCAGGRHCAAGAASLNSRQLLVAGV